MLPRRSPSRVLQMAIRGDDCGNFRLLKPFRVSGPCRKTLILRIHFCTDVRFLLHSATSSPWC